MIIFSILGSLAAIGMLCWLLFALAFVAPTAVAGFHARRGIVKHIMPSETWQLVFSVIGAIAVGITAFVRVTSMAAPGSSGQGVVTD